MSCRIPSRYPSVLSGRPKGRRLCSANTDTMEADTWYRKAMIEEFDLDQDGAINEQEFLAIMLDGE